jgi:Amidohydrolase family
LNKAGISIVALPASDICMMGREDDGNRRRGMCPVHELVRTGVTATFATNNIQNLFTFTGDGDMLKIGTLYCQIAQLSSENGALLCLRMATEIAAKALGVDHFLGENKPADIVILGDAVCGACSKPNSQSTSPSPSCPLTQTDVHTDSHTLSLHDSQILEGNHNKTHIITDTNTNTDQVREKNHNSAPLLSHSHSHSRCLPSAMILLSAPPVDRIVIKRGRVVSQTASKRAIYR